MEIIMARYPIMLLTIVLLTVAIAVTYFVKTQSGDKGLDKQPQVENRWDEWGNPSDPVMISLVDSLSPLQYSVATNGTTWIGQASRTNIKK